MRTAVLPQQGVSLVEVLVAVLVLSIGLLGLAGMNMAGIRNNHNAYMRSQATMASADMLDRLRLHRDAAIENGYVISMDDDVPTITEDTSQIESIVANWLNALTVLPSGDGSIDCQTVDGQCIVVVQWSERLSKGQGADVQTKSFTMRARL